MFIIKFTRSQTSIFAALQRHIELYKITADILLKKLPFEVIFFSWQNCEFFLRNMFLQQKELVELEFSRWCMSNLMKFLLNMKWSFYWTTTNRIRNIIQIVDDNFYYYPHKAEIAKRDKKLWYWFAYVIGLFDGWKGLEKDFKIAFLFRKMAKLGPPYDLLLNLRGKNTLTLALGFFKNRWAFRAT